MALPAINPMLPRTHRIERWVRETHDTFTIELETGNGNYHFLPGQFNMLYHFGVGEVPISISGDPNDPGTIVHTTRAVGGVTRAIEGMKRGDLIGIRGPFGSHWPVTESEGQDILIVTGGIGLAPLRPAIYEVLANRREYGRFTLLYGARSVSDLLYLDELKKWRGRFDTQIEVTVDSAKPDEWMGHVGLVTNLIPRANLDPFHTVAFVCGPGIMMKFVVRDLIKQGIKPEKIYVSMERNMQCGIGHCGRCQFGPYFTCKEGPVFRYDLIKDLFETRAL